LRVAGGLGSLYLLRDLCVVLTKSGPTTLRQTVSAAKVRVFWVTHMQVCTNCKKRSPDWMDPCPDCGGKLVEWTEQFDAHRKIWRGELDGSGGIKWVYTPGQLRDIHEYEVVVDDPRLLEDLDLDFNVVNPLPLVTQRTQRTAVVVRPKDQNQPIAKLTPFVLSINELCPHILSCIESIDFYSINRDRDHQRIVSIFGENHKKLFVGGMSFSGEVLIDRRVEFLQLLVSHFSSAKFKFGSTCNNLTIDLKTLLGSERNVRAFQGAIEEEVQSPWYREAVVLAGVTGYSSACEGLTWSEPKHLVVGGSSGAGKTFGAKRIMRAIELCKQFEVKRKVSHVLTITGGKDVTANNGTKIETIVSVDGGDARAVSQIRGIVLQCALALGYKGISDLQKYTGKMDFKEHIKNAAAVAKVHVVEPRTFATSEETFEGVVVWPDRTIFCMVHAPANCIKAQGDSRAWFDYSPNKKLKFLPIKPNKREIGCESKAYGSAGRLPGLVFSQKAISTFVSKQNVRGKTHLVVELVTNSVLLPNNKVSYAAPSYVWVYYGEVKFDTVLGGFAVKNPLKESTPEAIEKAGESFVVHTDGTKVIQFPDKYCVIYPGAR
jgi:hypothetical protein